MIHARRERSLMEEMLQKVFQIRFAVGKNKEQNFYKPFNNKVYILIWNCQILVYSRSICVLVHLSVYVLRTLVAITP